MELEKVTTWKNVSSSKNYEGVNLKTPSSLKDVDYHDIVFSKSHLEITEIENCSFQNVEFNKCQIRLRFDNCKFINCRFISCQLSQSRIVGSEFFDSIFQRCNLALCEISIGINFTRCEFAFCNWGKSRYFYGLSFSDCCITGKVYGAVFVASKVMGGCGEIKNLDLSKCELTFCQFIDYPWEQFIFPNSSRFLFVPDANKTLPLAISELYHLEVKDDTLMLLNSVHYVIDRKRGTWAIVDSNQLDEEPKKDVVIEMLRRKVTEFNNQNNYLKFEEILNTIIKKNEELRER